MDILNFISWIRGRRQVTSVDPNKTLIPVGLKDGRRDDDYLAGAISVTDLAAQIGGGSPFQTMFNISVNKATVSITSALEGTSIPDGATDSYVKTIPLPFDSPTLLYCAITNSSSTFQTGMPNINFGITTSQGINNGNNYYGIPSNTEIRFIVNSDYTQARLAGRVTSQYFQNESGATYPYQIDFPSYTQQNNILVGTYVGPFGDEGFGYTGGSIAPQSNSVLKSAYIDGNNLVLLFRKRTATSSISWDKLDFNVYNFS